MIQAFITTATKEIPKMFETGWDWWAWPLAWIILALAALILAAAAPIFAVTVGTLEDSGWKVPAAIGVIVLVLAAAATGFAAPGVMMRHMDSGDGAFWVFLGSVLVGMIGWAVSASIHSAHLQAYDTRRWMIWVAAVPAIVIGLGAVLNGIGEIITRLAASIPMPVAQFLAVVVVGAILLGLHAASPNRR